MKNKKYWLKIYLKVLILCSVISACTSSPVSTQAVNPKPVNTSAIIIGGVLCMTGPIAFADIPAMQGAQLAVAELNKSNGVLGRKVEFKNLDCQGDPNITAKAADQIIQQGASAIITSGTYYFGAPASREAQKAGLVGISPTASSSLFGSKTLGDKQFTLSMWNNTMGAAAAEFAYKSKGWHTVYVITDTGNDYTISLSRYFMMQFKKLGGNIYPEDTFKTGETDFSLQLAHVQGLSHPPDFFFLSSGMPEAPMIIHTFRSAGILIPVVGGDSYDDPTLFKAVGSDNGNGIYFVTHTFLQAGVTSEMAHFLEAYKAVYGKVPDSNLVAPGWDAVMVLAEAMQKAGSSDGSAMAKVMENTEFSLLTGKLRWSSAQDGHQPNIEAALVTLDQAAPKFVGWILPSSVPAP
jgi:branched-chain amino acid transport system substrate-binding protein